MKTMRKWRLNGQVTLDVYVDVVAETLEEAIEIAEDDVSITEYCGAQVGVDYYADEEDEADLVDGGMGIEWNETYSELKEEWEEEEYADDWDDEEDE